MHQLEHRGKEIDGTGDGPNSSSCGHPGATNNQRHAKGRFIDEIAVDVLAVLAERFSMIGCDDDHGRVQYASIVQRTDQPADQIITPRHLAVVWTSRVARGVWLRRRIRS